MDERYSGWTGLAGFAGILLLMVGVFGFIMGLAALFNNSYFVVAESGLLVFNYTTWGWIHVGLGLLLMATGIGVMAGESWALVVGIIIASFNAVAQLAFLSANPGWSTIVIALDILVIYALATHGGYLAEETTQTARTTTTPQDTGATDRQRRVG